VARRPSRAFLGARLAGCHRPVAKLNESLLRETGHVLGDPVMSDPIKQERRLQPSQEIIRAKCFDSSALFVPFNRQEIEQSIPERFEKMAAQYPDCIAVKTQRRTLTYRDLNEQANRLARALLVKRGERQEPVMLLFEHGAQEVAALLGTLKAGKFYAPLDPSFPPDRIRIILHDCAASVLVTNRLNLQLASSLATGSTEVLDMDALGADISDRAFSLSLSPRLIACILYTSGSTGQSKGIVQDHRSILHRAMICTNMLHITRNDRLSLLHSCSFGAAIYHLFSSLLNGASLFPFDAQAGGGLSLARWLSSERISVYHSVPTLFRQLTADMNGSEELTGLRVVSLTGAPISSDDVRLYKKYFPERSVLLHLMGATETGWMCQYFIDHASSVADGTIPVGYAVEDKELILVDDNGDAVAADQAGEISVKSRYLAAGYWGNAELTQAKFKSDPSSGDERTYLTGDLGRMNADGCLVHLGRKDFLAKIRGFRVEVGEVESALLALGYIREATVVARSDRQNEKGLLAYIVPAAQSAVRLTSLRGALREKLPEYMIPESIVILSAMPLTTNGKIDRGALPDPDRSRPPLDNPFTLPATPVEETLAKIWSEALNITAVGVHDDFFDLGGHSLPAMRIISKVKDTLGVELSMRNLLDAATVAGLAEIIEALQKTSQKADELSPDHRNKEDTGEL